MINITVNNLFKIHGLITDFTCSPLVLYIFIAIYRYFRFSWIDSLHNFFWSPVNPRILDSYFMFVLFDQKISLYIHAIKQQSDDRMDVQRQTDKSKRAIMSKIK